ncbi:hypothetical protein ACFC18_40115 [Streptomyces sp. NPDC056121]|uniref:hypothetical protein n=2 Tax=unclassified Streptomyces TaxID=2593676 RepID=UPI0035E0D824
MEVLRGALAHSRRPSLWPARLAPPRTLLPRFPLVLGLRLFPRSGSAEDLALARGLSDMSAAARAAFVLRSVYCLSDDIALDLLTSAGVDDAASALRAASALKSVAGEAPAMLLTSQEFDACALQASPTDLLRRRQRTRLGVAAVALSLIVGTVVVTALPDEATSQPVPPTVAADPALRPAHLTHAPAELWDNTSRIDFTAWPARGTRVKDESLLGRALSVWARPPSGTRVSLAPATSAAAPSDSPQLLYAGNVSDRAVVLLYDGQRLARYSESLSPARHAALSVARVDDADVTTAGAVALGTVDGGARYLIAPWSTEVQIRDLLRPEVLAHPLRVGKDGVTEAVPTWSSASDCGSRPALQLRSSDRIAEHHAFLVAGLGDLTPVHLTYTPLPGHGSPPARRPREATGTTALLAWAHQACSLGSLRNTGARAVNAWDFAEQDLPDGGGHALWSCARTDTWQGPGNVTVTMRTAQEATDAPAGLVARARSTAACSRFGQHIVAFTDWRSPKGRWYALVAGSRAVTRVTISGGITTSRAGRTLALPADGPPRIKVSARLATGARLTGIGPPDRAERP